MRCHAPQAQAKRPAAAAAVQAKPAPRRALQPAGENAGFSLADVLIHAPPVAAAAGAALPERLRAGVEALSGLAMDDVRVHRNSPEPARLGALAYTQGSDIHLGPGQERHLSHEAWHVVQQKQGRVQATTQRKGMGLNEDTRLETEADHHGSAAMALYPAPGAASVCSSAMTQSHDLANDKRAVQLRRVPETEELEAALPPGDTSPAIKGMARVLSRAWTDLGFMTDAKGAFTPDSLGIRRTSYGIGLQSQVKQDMQPFVWADERDLYDKLSTRELVLQLAAAIRKASSVSVLAHPFDVLSQPGQGEAEISNLVKLVDQVSWILGFSASGYWDVDIANVFGGDHVDDVKTEYRAAEGRLGGLEKELQIRVDRSGFMKETDTAGLTNPTEMVLEPSVINTPDEKDSVITVVHESMHAGSSKIRDFGYIRPGDMSFTGLPEEIKLSNADHYTVVPRRIIGLEPTFAGIVFTPAQDPAKKGEAPAKTDEAQAAGKTLTPDEKAMRETSETFRSAWYAALNIHLFLIRVADDGGKWSKGPYPFGDFLPYWSAVEELTLHDRMAATQQAPASGPEPDTSKSQPAVPPPPTPIVTVVDLALSEGLIRKLAIGMALCPNEAATAQNLQVGRDYKRYEESVGDWEKGRDLLIEAILDKYCKGLTSSLKRDICVLKALADAGFHEAEFSRKRGPSAFKCEGG